MTKASSPSVKKILPFHGICSEYHKKKSMLKDNQPTAMDYFTQRKRLILTVHVFTYIITEFFLLTAPC